MTTLLSAPGLTQRPVTATTAGRRAQRHGRRSPAVPFQAGFRCARRASSQISPFQADPRSRFLGFGVSDTTGGASSATGRTGIRVGDSESVNAVIPWISGKAGQTVHCKLAVRELSDGRGRGLVVTEDVVPCETLLSVPFTHAFIEEPAESPSDGAPWSSGMALRLLRILTTDSDAEVADSESHLLPWARTLPPRVDTPPIQFPDAELDACLDGNTVREARLMREAHREGLLAVAGEVSAMGLSAADFDWAVSVLHSRCFVLQPSGLHISVPGIDMANHSFTPNAGVRASHSPETCQGRSAVEDVCEPPEPEPSRFELVAGEAAIRAGEEVTISYGAWPNDLFFLLFAFLPDPNPHDSLVLFDGAEEVLRFLNQTAAQSGAPHWKAEELEAEVVEATTLDELRVVDFSRLVVTWEGFDARMMPALHAAIQRHPASEVITAGELAVERCISLWSHMQTQTQQQRRELTAEALTENMKLSLQYSFHKQEVLENALRSVGMLN